MRTPRLLALVSALALAGCLPAEWGANGILLVLDALPPDAVR